MDRIFTTKYELDNALRIMKRSTYVLPIAAIIAFLCGIAIEHLEESINKKIYFGDDVDLSFFRVIVMIAAFAIALWGWKKEKDTKTLIKLYQSREKRTLLHLTESNISGTALCQATGEVLPMLSEFQITYDDVLSVGAATIDATAYRFYSLVIATKTHTYKFCIDSSQEAMHIIQQKIKK